jgi:hypothetical protein
MSTINERVRTVASMAGMDRLVRETPIGSNRWRTVLYNKDVRIELSLVDGQRRNRAGDRPDQPRIRRSQPKLGQSKRGIAITQEVARRWYARRLR